MKIKCEHISNRGNGDNCKISPKDSKSLLLQGCTFYRGNGLNGKVKGKEALQVQILCLNLSSCYAKENDRDYWKAVIVPQAQKKIRYLDKRIEAKEKIRV